MLDCGADGLSSACALAILLKYSKARRSSWVTPLPSAYIFPSFHCASGWPPSAAYCNAVRLDSGVAGGTTFFSGVTVPGWAATTGIVASWLVGAPSKANPAVANGVAPNTNATMIRLDVRITLFLVRTTRVGHRPTDSGPNLLGVFPQRTRCMMGLAWLPFGLTFGEFGVGQLYVKCPDHGIDLDDIAVLQQSNGTADRCFRPDMADAEAAGGAGEP